MDYMARALSLARQALGTTSPNPAVGAVIVSGGQVVGEGATQPPGSAHAEVVALAQAEERARGATLYVTLEPCCHHGRTPPCTDAVIAAGISKVHIALIDPNPRVSGEGRRLLEEAGIETTLGEHEDEARRLNEGYIKLVTTGTPFITAKFATSLDGRIATASGDSRWISGEESRWCVHQMRRAADAIMVGVNTVIADDPQLTARDDEGRPWERQPLRVVVDSEARTPPAARLLAEPGRTVVATTAHAPQSRRDALEKAGAELVMVPARGGLVDLAQLLAGLGARGLASVLVEGGGTLLGSLFAGGLVDKVVAFVAPLIIGGEGARTAVGGEGALTMAQALHLHDVSVERLGDDIMVIGYVRPRAGESDTRSTVRDG